MPRSLSMKSLPGMMKFMHPFCRLFFAEHGGKSAAQAARSTGWGATATGLKGVTARYFDTHMKEPSLHSTAYERHVQAQILAPLAGAVA
jgi:hypothetical protein